MLVNRNKEELLLSNVEYAKLKNEIDLLLNDDFEEQLKIDLDLIKFDSPYDWVNYDLGLAKINPIHRSIYAYVLTSFFLGLILSSIFTLIIHSYQNRKFN